MSTITYKQIPARLRVPGVFVEQTSRLDSASERINTLLHLGYANGGKADTNKIYKINTLADARSLFGNSMLTDMAERHLDLNKGLALYQVAVPPPTTQTPALGSIEIREAATTAGVLSVRIADKLVSIALTANQTQAAIASALALAINTANVAVSAEVHDYAITLTAKIPGLLGNEIPVLVGYNFEEQPPIEVIITPMHSGVGAPDLTAALAAMGEDPYDYIVSAFLDTTSLQKLDETIAERWHAMAAFNIQSLVFGVVNSTYTAIQTKGKALNSEFTCLLGVENAPQAPWIWAASLVAIAADQLTNDPSAPIIGISVPGLKAPRKCWHWKQRNELLFSGISTFTSDKAGNVYIEQLITTYQYDAQGYEDASYLSIHVPELMRNIRRVQASLLGKSFQRYKLTDYPEQHAGGQLITSTTGIEAFLIGIYDKELMDKRSWCTDKDSYKNTIKAERDADNRGRINYHDEPVMIGRLEIIAGQSTLRHG